MNTIKIPDLIWEEQINQPNDKVCSYCFELIDSSKKQSKVCPHCGGIGWNKSLIERRCFWYQDMYLHHRQAGNKEEADKYLAGLYEVFLEYARGLIKKVIKGRINLTEDTLEIKSNDVAFLMLEKYLEDDTHKFEVSFGGYMQFKAREVMLNKKQQRLDNIYSIHDKVESEVELVDLLADLSIPAEKEFGVDFYLRDLKADELVETVWKLITAVAEDIRESSNSLMAVNYQIAMKNFFEGQGDIHLDNLCSYHEGLDLKILVDDSITELRMFLSEHAGQK